MFLKTSVALIMGNLLNYLLHGLRTGSPLSMSVLIDYFLRSITRLNRWIIIEKHNLLEVYLALIDF
jgi:hypothetical protein